MLAKVIPTAVWAFCLLACVSVSSAQEVSFDIERLSLQEIDKTLEEIERRLALASIGVAPATPIVEEPTDDNTTNNASALLVDRSRTSPRCFADNFQNLTTPVQMDQYFDRMEDQLNEAMVYLGSVVQLQTGLQNSSCTEPMQGLLQVSSTSIAAISRPELSDLTFHLETCWPDDVLNEVDGSDLDVDSRYTRARQILQLLGRAQLQLSQATEACG